MEKDHNTSLTVTENELICKYIPLVDEIVDKHRSELDGIEIDNLKQDMYMMLIQTVQELSSDIKKLKTTLRRRLNRVVSKAKENANDTHIADCLDNITYSIENTICDNVLRDTLCDYVMDSLHKCDEFTQHVVTKDFGINATNSIYSWAQIAFLSHASTMACMHAEGDFLRKMRRSSYLNESRNDYLN